MRVAEIAVSRTEHGLLRDVERALCRLLAARPPAGADGMAEATWALVVADLRETIAELAASTPAPSTAAEPVRPRRDGEHRFL